MSITTCQKVTLISCSVLCVSLFLPKILLSRGKSEIGQQLEVGPGFYPPMTHRLSAPEDPDQWDEMPPYTKVQSAEALAKVTGKGRARKHNLIGQVIPIYGFGVLLYILYMIHKLTCRPKGKPGKSEYYYSRMKPGNTGSRQVNEYELIRLQEQLLETERMMEKIISGKTVASGKGRSWRRASKKAVCRKEEQLLKQLKQITQVMQEGRLEVGSPEMEAEEVPYTADWEGYDEETFPEYPEDGQQDSGCTMVVLKVPESTLLTAEALAERMEQEEEVEFSDRKLHVVQEEEEEEEEEREEEEEEEEEEGEEAEEEEEDVEEETEEEENDEDLEDDEVEVAEKRLLLSSPLRLRSAGGGEEERLGLEVSEEMRRREPGQKHISFSDHRDVFRYPREDNAGRGKQEDTMAEEEMDEEEWEEEEEELEGEEEEEEEGEEEEEEEEEEGEEEEGDGPVRDGAGEAETDEEDPVMEAESLSFSLEESANPEAEAEEASAELLLALEGPLGGAERPDPSPEPGIAGLTGLRSRNRRTT